MAVTESMVSTSPSDAATGTRLPYKDVVIAASDAEALESDSC